MRLAPSLRGFFLVKRAKQTFFWPPGPSLACDLQGLAQYGNGFLGRLELAQCPSPLLSEVTLVDTPGVLSGEKQRIERTYNFLDVCGWFAARCDLILLLFDPHKLDISDEMKQVTFRLERCIFLH